VNLAKRSVVVASILTALTLSGGLPAQSPDAQHHFTNGRALFEEHDDSGDALRDAEAEFREALRLAPKYAAAQAYLGFIAAENEKFDRAEAAYRQALTWDSRCAEAMVGLARLEIKEGRREAALGLMRQAIHAAPRNALAHRELGYFLSSNVVAVPTLDEWKEAIASFEVLVQFDKNDRDSHYQLGQAYRALAGVTQSASSAKSCASARRRKTPTYGSIPSTPTSATR